MIQHATEPEWAHPHAACLCSLANALVGNDDRAAALEMTLTGPSIKFLTDSGGMNGLARISCLARCLG